MISSIACGIAGLLPGSGADAALVWPVDHPLADASAVVRAAARGVIVVPRHAGRGGHPTAFGADLFDELAAAQGAPDGARGAAPEGARGVVRRDPGRVVHVEVEDAASLIDVDTPGDYDKIKNSPS
jgi:molybdenum cofactor cytidylyltransferase